MSPPSTDAPRALLAAQSQTLRIVQRLQPHGRGAHLAEDIDLEARRFAPRARSASAAARPVNSDFEKSTKRSSPVSPGVWSGRKSLLNEPYAFSRRSDESARPPKCVSPRSWPAARMS